MAILSLSGLRQRISQSAFGSRGRINVGDVERIASLLAGGGLLWSAVKRPSWTGGLLAMLGGGLIHRAVTGHCNLYDALGVDTVEHPAATAIPAQQGEKIEQRILIRRPVSEVYDAWADLERLPQIMGHLVSVEQTGEGRSHWVAKGPIGSQIAWDAEEIERERDRVISWRSLPGSRVDTAGSVHFTPVGEEATELRVSLKYNPPGGKAGAAIAAFLGQRLSTSIGEDLTRFKDDMEARRMLGANI